MPTTTSMIDDKGSILIDQFTSKLPDESLQDFYERKKREDEAEYRRFREKADREFGDKNRAEVGRGKRSGE